MVVNVDHTCPAKIAGSTCVACILCGGTGIIRAPADQCKARTVEDNKAWLDDFTLDLARASQALKEVKEGKWRYAEDVVKDLSGENDVMNAAESYWMKSTVAQGLLPPSIEKETAMEWSFEAGYKAGSRNVNDGH